MPVNKCLVSSFHTANITNLNLPIHSNTPFKPTKYHILLPHIVLVSSLYLERGHVPHHILEQSPTFPPIPLIRSHKVSLRSWKLHYVDTIKPKSPQSCPEIRPKYILETQDNTPVWKNGSSAVRNAPSAHSAPRTGHDLHSDTSLLWQFSMLIIQDVIK